MIQTQNFLTSPLIPAHLKESKICQTSASTPKVDLRVIAKQNLSSHALSIFIPIALKSAPAFLNRGQFDGI